MSEAVQTSIETSPKRKWPKRALWSALALLGVVILALIALRIFITTASGARFIESQINSRSFGRIEAIEISGLSGDPLSAFSVEGLEIKDKDGVWLEASNIDIDWKPFAFLKDHVWIKTLGIEETSVLRRPVLNAGSPDSGSGDDGLKITLEQFGLDTVDINEALIGQTLSLNAFGEFAAQPNGAVKAALKAKRLDIAGDSLDLDFTRTRKGQMTGDFYITGLADGPIAALLKAPVGTPIKGSGIIRGDLNSGDGEALLRLGDTENVTAKLAWTEADITASADINLEGWTAFETIASRAGNTLTSRARLDRLSNPRAFTADIDVPGLMLKASGTLPESGYRPEEAMIDVAIQTPSTFIALPENYTTGAAAAKGHVRLSEPYAFDGTVSVSNVTTPYGSAAKLSGPLKVSEQGDKLYMFDTNIAASDLKPEQTLPIEIGKSTRLMASGQIDQNKSQIVFQTLSLAAGANTFKGAGSASFDGSAADMKGAAALTLIADGNRPGGKLKADITAKKRVNAALAISADGAFRPSTPLIKPLGDLVGEQAVFQTRLSFKDGTITLKQADIVGDAVKASAAGTIGDRLALSGEVFLSAPVTYNKATLSSGTEALFEVSGTRGAPSIRVDAKTDTLTVPSYVFTSVRLRADLDDLTANLHGPVQIEASTEHGDLLAAAALTTQNGTYTANEIDLTWGRMQAEGNISLPPNRIAAGNIALNLPKKGDQYASASLALSNLSGEQGLTFEIDAKEIAVSEFNFDHVKANASGTLAALSGAVDIAGRRGEGLNARQFTVKSPLKVSRRDDGGYTASATPTAQYGNIDLSARTPVTASFKDGDITLNVPLNVADGSADIVYSRGKDGETAVLDAKNLPMGIMPLPGLLADTRARVSAVLDMQISSGTGLRGTGVLTIDDWRGYGIDKGEGLTGNINVNVNNQKATATLDSRSPAGFTGTGNITLPLLPAETFSALRLNMSAPITGQYDALGAAIAVLGLVTPSDAELGGNLAANVSLSGTLSAPNLDGTASGSDIQFEGPSLGTQFRSGRFKASFTQDSLKIDDIYTADTSGGSVSGAGAFTLGELGRPIGKIEMKAENFKALDRKDVSAEVKGNVVFESLAKTANLSGDITLNRAEVKQFVSGTVSVIEIEVEEINRPEGLAPIVPKAKAAPITMDIRVRAPRRIFVRSRGLDVEMSLDAQIKGSLGEPLIYGEAKVLRGGYKIAGKTLEFTDGTIKFDGEVSKASIDFTAETETQNLNASVSIKGTVEAPEIVLSSSPERPQDEILSALLFGRSATDLSTIEAAQLAGALAQMSGKGGGFDLLGGLRDAFGIGQLSVNFNEDGSAQLVGGRYLAKNVYLQVFSGAGTDQTGAIIDWEIRKNISLRSRIRTDNDQSLSLKWKRDF